MVEQCLLIWEDMGVGRKKAGKPRRARAAAGYNLQQFQPPGYDQWMILAPTPPRRPPPTPASGPRPST
ncbi:hypothetical protein GCM10009760_63560 [Kitasatospora kazusensis]|uniref:Uncharacterized protein n=1 Tax=Kitasatospora kazusensis TaxID=407974 RepID=A0ABN1ZME0_9ACTN